MYGRTVRGIIHILGKLWTQEIDEQEMKSSYRYVLDLCERHTETLKLVKEQLNLLKQGRRNISTRKQRLGASVLATSC